MDQGREWSDMVDSGIAGAGDATMPGNRPGRAAPFSLGRLPHEAVRISGGGQGRMREMLGFAARRTETLVWSWDEGELVMSSTNQDMLHGRVEALEVFGIGDGWRIDETDLPLSFRATDPSGRSRTISFGWDGSEDDMMSLPPHVRRWNPTVRTLAVVALGVASWWGVYEALKAIGAF
jgi:hypothetical protein